MNGHERKSLWDLLGHASPARASKGFCQRVTQRACSLRQHSQSAILSISAAAAAFAVLGLGAALLLLPSPPPLAETMIPALHQPPAQVSWTEEFEGIVLMDELLAVNDPSVLDDEALAKLLFH